MYKTIINPKTRRRVKITSRLGRKIIKDYIKQLGGFLTEDEKIDLIEEKCGDFNLIDDHDSYEKCVKCANLQLGTYDDIVDAGLNKCIQCVFKNPDDDTALKKCIEPYKVWVSALCDDKSTKKYGKEWYKGRCKKKKLLSGTKCSIKTETECIDDCQWEKLTKNNICPKPSCKLIQTSNKKLNECVHNRLDKYITGNITEKGSNYYKFTEDKHNKNLNFSGTFKI